MKTETATETGYSIDLGVIEKFDIAIFEQIENSTFKIGSKLPKWLNTLYPEAGNSNEFNIIYCFPFLINFFNQAQSSWKINSSEKLTSELWTETDTWGNEYFFRVHAINTAEQKLLLFTPVDFDYEKEKKPAHKTRNGANIRSNEKTEAALKRLEKFKEDFVSVVSHDLRGKLSNVITISNFMLHPKYTGQVSERVKELLDSINSELKQLLEYSDKIYHWTNLEHGKINLDIKPVKLFSLFWDVKTHFESKLDKKNLKIKIDVDEDIIVNIDKEMFCHVVNNIVGNAIKYTPRDGKIILKGEQRNGNTVVKISDTGIGIAAELMDNLFSDFFQQHTVGTEGEKGNGLGLSICKKIVDAHGFTISAKSTKNIGSDFIITM